MDAERLHHHPEPDPAAVFAHGRAEQALRASEEHFRLIVEGARDYGIFTMGPEGTIQSWSPGAEAVYGRTADEAIGQDVGIIFVPEDRAAGAPEWERQIAARQGSAPDVRWHQRGDGSLVFIEGVTRALYDGSGGVRGFLKIGQDVTRRRQMEEALRESEERFRSLIRNIRDYAIFMLNAQGVVTEWTEGAERVKGYTAAEAIGRHVSHFFTPDEVAAGLPHRVLAEAAGTGRVESEGWRVRKGGERFWANEIVTAIRGADGALAGFTKICRDLTEQRRARAELERFKTLSEQANDAFFIIDPRGRIHWVNRAACERLGYAFAELTSRTVGDIDPLVPGEEFGGYFERARQRRMPPFESVHRRSDGSTLPVEISAAVVEGEDGAYMLAAARDITERKRAETALRELNESLERRVEERTREVGEQQERFRTLVETAALMVWTTDAEGRVVEDSPSWRAFTGQTREEWLAQGWASAIHPDDRAFAAERWFASFPAGSQVNAELRVWHAASARWRWTNVRVVPLRGDDGAVRGWIGMNIDIDERKRAEAARSEALRQLVTAEEQERVRLSRELHDQMGQLVTALQLGLRALEEGPERVPAALGGLERLAEQIAREVHHVASALRPAALDRLGLRPALQAHLEEWSARYAVAADFHAVGIDGQRFPPEVETTLFRAVQEGLTNVARHAGASSVSLLLERRRGAVGVILEDDGRGFDADAAEAARAGRFGLLGMRERVELLGGKMQIESRPGAGTTLFVRLPDRPAPGEPAPEEAGR